MSHCCSLPVKSPSSPEKVRRNVLSRTLGGPGPSILRLDSLSREFCGWEHWHASSSGVICATNDETVGFIGNISIAFVSYKTLNACLIACLIACLLQTPRFERDFFSFYDWNFKQDPSNSSSPKSQRYPDYGPTKKFNRSSDWNQRLERKACSFLRGSVGALLCIFERSLFLSCHSLGSRNQAANTCTYSQPGAGGAE
ncbi:hypothetical protein K0M31_001137, partial [Melipona bicolor]